MKKLFSVLLSVIFVLILLPTSNVSTALAHEDDVIINIKDFGAVGDGKTNDRGAIMAAFNYAITNYACVLLHAGIIRMSLIHSALAAPHPIIVIADSQSHAETILI